MPNRSRTAIIPSGTIRHWIGIPLPNSNGVDETKDPSPVNRVSLKFCTSGIASVSPGPMRQGPRSEPNSPGPDPLRPKRLMKLPSGAYELTDDAISSTT